MCLRIIYGFDMKSLKLFIEDNETISEDCYEVYNYAQLFYVQQTAPHKLNILEKLPLFEGDSVFGGCYEMSLVVAKAIDKDFDKMETGTRGGLIVTHDILKKHHIKNIYFKKAVIYVHKDWRSKSKFAGSAIFDASVSDYFWNPVECMFDEIQIDITLPYDYYEHKSGEDTPSSLELIMHEFRHGEQDIGLHVRGRSLLELNGKLEDIIKDPVLADYEKDIIRNIATKNECEAYIAQIDGEIKGRTFKDIKSATIWLDKHCNIWKQYIELKRIVDRKCTKKTQVMFYRGWDKFINHVGHLLNKHTDKSNMTLENYKDFTHLIQRNIDIENLIEELENTFAFI